ncbi:hypothetical protein llap_17867 [Limosa lapponica baueri]|uniref:Uncharacterized protein n=1 Tax=Limosa lapponica baueri TaxID=1758121 RepID=A0A2I0TDD8_LIMLA|nr:hypothetical protein llap_17867 [Limosa lapponica baueri]
MPKLKWKELLRYLSGLNSCPRAIRSGKMGRKEQRSDFHPSTVERSADPPLRMFVIPNVERWVRLTEGTDYSPSVEAENGFSKTSVGAEQVKSQSS